MSLTLESANDIRQFDDYFKLKSDEKAVIWSGFSCAPDYNKLKEHFLNLISSKKIVFFLKDDTSVIGYCQYNRDNDFYELEGYSILSEYSGKGFGSKMIQMSLVELRSFTPRLERGVIAWVSINNKSSIKCLINNGFIITQESQYRELKALNRQDKFIKMSLQ